ncbi:RNA-binding protein [Pseudenhygromyxa sp. WMMC2535]|uniref:RNA-binding protein n=1 Tax=Pseudenhygromyxa sp. WMMC2535 TaxID=2712867 RepID=UPI0031F88874
MGTLVARGEGPRIEKLREMSTKLFVGGLPWAMDNQRLKEVFAEFGVLEDARVILDRETGRSRGFGFVTYADDEGAEKALQLDGQEVDGRRIRVDRAQEKERGGGRGRPRPGGGGGGGGGGGRSFDGGGGGGRGRGGGGGGGGFPPREFADDWGRGGGDGGGGGDDRRGRKGKGKGRSRRRGGRGGRGGGGDGFDHGGGGDFGDY